MADILSKAQRSRLMSRIRGRNNKGTELVLASLLRRHHITGWRRHSSLPGTPDFAMHLSKLAIFVDGCFWHGCAKCARNLTPTSNTAYWSEKLVANRRRDQRANRRLRQDGWRVIRIWEHDIKKRPEGCISRIQRKMAQ